MTGNPDGADAAEAERAKTELRREMRRRRKSFRFSDGGALRPEAAEADRRLAMALLSLPEIAACGSVFIYRSLPSEAGTGEAVSLLLAQGKLVFLPRTSGSRMDPVPYAEGTKLSRGAFGIEEPEGDAGREVPEVTVLPLLAADADGNRLGCGGGYYDRYLCGKKTLRIGYCYDFQVVGRVCAQAHDERLDIIVTDTRVLRMHGGGGERQ